jgi:pyridoxal phosphate enzyme (YggS family)
VIDTARIARNLALVRGRLEQAARTAGRDPASVRLVAISKTFPVDVVRSAFAAGQVDFGENRVQEALQKVRETAELHIRWHLVGHLQTNKARKAAESFAFVHSVDSVDLLLRLDVAAVEQQTAPNLLIQVDLAGEATKFGAAERDLPILLETAERLHAAQIVGLMVLPPFADDPEAARPWFRRLREMRDRLVSDGVPPARLRELSMGMSHDFHVAIEEGATIVRVGTAIFGERTPAGAENSQ